MARKPLLGAVLAALVLVTGCQTQGKDAVATGGTFQFVSPGGKTEIIYPAGERAPIRQLSGDSLMEPGKTVSLDDWAGHVVVVNMWGQWCGPCRTEVDDMQRIHEYLAGQGGAVLGVNVRDYSEPMAQDFIKEAGATFPSIYDPPFKTAANMGGLPASVVPTTMVLDKQHKVAAVYLREVTDTEIIALAEQLAQE